MIGYWQWLLLLACPSMMIFIMRGMSRGDGGTRRAAHHSLLPGQVCERPPPAQPLMADERTRIAQLEHDLA